MKNKENILLFLLTILCIINVFGTPPPPPPSVPPTTLIVSKFVPCNKNNNGKCLEVKVVENNKTEIITGIKNFNYDNNYIYTIKVKQINEPGYKYDYVTTIKKEFIPPIPPPEIKLIVLQFTPCIDNSNEECFLVRRLDKSKTETVRIKGFDYDKCYTYTLLVKESNESNYKYILKKILDTRKKSECSDHEYLITIDKDGLDDPDYIRYMKEGETVLTSLPKKYYKGPELSPNIRYVLKIKEVVIDDQTYIEFVEQIEPKPEKVPEPLPCPKPTPTVFYDCNNKENRIATCNDVMYTNFMLENDGSLEIKPVDQNIPFYKFYGNICDFTFQEDHKYTLEVKKDGVNYILIKVLCDKKMGIIQNPTVKKYPDCATSIGSPNPPPGGGIGGSVEPPLPPRPKITDLDKGVWYLRYLFQADSLTPVNNLTDTTYYIKTDISLNKIKTYTPCGYFYDKLLTDEVNKSKFNYESLTITFKKCDTTTNLLFEQMEKVNHYEIVDNKLKLSINKPEFTEQKVLIIFEGIPK